MNIYLDDILREVGEPDAAFPLSMKLEPFELLSSDPDFSEENVLQAAKLTESDDAGTARLCEAADFLRKNDMFRYAAICMYRGIFQKRDDAYLSFSAAGEHLAESIRMLIRLFSAPEVKRWHREQNIPEEYSAQTLRYLRASETNFAGCFPNAGSYSWLRQLLYPELLYLQIVRFGFAVQPREWNSVTFRHENGSFLSFAKAGTYVNEQGLVITKENYQQNGGYLTSFKIENGYFRGNPITEDGRISLTAEKIPVDGYHIFLQDGDPVINMHIPGGGGMTPELTRKSWYQAKRFYMQHMGQNCPKAIACGSWACSPAMEDILPPESNLVKFVKSVRRLPNEAGPFPVYHYIHHGTSLSKAVDQFIADRGQFWDGSMFIPLDEIE